MITALIVCILIWQFYIGYSRGIILQAFYTLATVLSLVIASHYYVRVAKLLELWVPYSNASEGAEVAFFTNVKLFDLSQVYYAGVAFTGLFVLAYLAFRLLGILIHLAPVHFFDSIWVNVVSGILAMLLPLVFLSLVFSTLATVPMPAVQNLLSSSAIAKTLINHFPILSKLIQQLWVTAILK